MSCLIWSIWLTMSPLATTSCEQAWQQAFVPSLQAAQMWSEENLRMPSSAAAVDDDNAPVRFIWPVAKRQISSGFGQRLHPVLGRMMQHKGMDIPVPFGSSVHAIADGEVVESGYDRGAGYFITLRHADGWQSRYFHLASTRVRKGEKLTAGEEIAASGSSGFSTGPHLHLEIAWRG
ncbi:M23 family metallopeptidase, partial [Citrobacter braakii]|uniref:M23 family metallopeptidase n=3 Tax=Enterobacteriaceae TaxID=543 RepID=UPI0030809E24